MADFEYRPSSEVVRRLRAHVRRSSLPSPGSRFQRYEILEEIGRGALGVVYRARQQDLDRIVALKILRQAGDEEARRAFAREAHLAADLDHPNIAKIFDVGEEQGLPFIAMQWIDGETLADARERLDEKGKVACIAQAAEALAFAHERNVVHRDLKPSNLMVDRRGTAFVMDFGLAKRTAIGTESLTAAGVVRGTPGFMSPEQARGQARLIDARSDVYSLGATFYALLTGRAPFESRDGEDIVGLLNRVANDEPPRPRGVSRELQAVVLMAMERDRDRRYADSAEFARDLRRYQNGEPIRARRPGFLYRARKKLAKHRGAAVAGASALLIAIAFAGYLFQLRLLKSREKAWAIREAQRSEAQGSWESALAAYRHALALDPRDGGTRVKATEMERRSREARLENVRKSAELIYREAEREFYHLRMRTYVPGWKLTDSDFEKYARLAGTCEERMREAGESGSAWWVVGQTRYLHGDWTGAEVAYRRGLAVEPDHALCLLDCARLLLEQSLIETIAPPPALEESVYGGDRPTQALALLERGIRSGSLSEIEIDLARGYQRLLNRLDSRDYCDQMLRKWQGKEFADEFLLVRGMSYSTDLEANATALLRVRPSFYPALLWRATIRNDQGRARQAIEDLDRVLEIHPRLAAGYFVRGLCRGQMKDTAGALADMDKALAVDPKSVRMLTMRAVTRMAQGDSRGALQDCDQAVASDPDAPLGYAVRGLVRRQMSDHRGAIEDYTRALQARPRTAYLHFNRGNAFLACGEPGSAIRDYTQAMEIEPGYAVACNNRGKAREAAGDPEGALEDYARAIEFDPKGPDPYVARGLLLMSRHEHARAIPEFSRAIEVTSEKDAGPFVRRGEARLASGDPDGALEDFTRALQLQPRWSDVYVDRAIVQEWLARMRPQQAAARLRAASEDLEKALEAAPEAWTHRSKAIALLEKVRATQNVPK